jgi:hypothetical protein
MPDSTQQPNSNEPTGSMDFPYRPSRTLALVLLIAALMVIFGTGLWWLWKGKTPGYTGGGTAATVGILFVLALILRAPTI